MDNMTKATLTRFEDTLHAIASGQKDHGNLLRTIAERQEEIIKLLTPEPKDGPSLDELLGQLVSQMTEVIGYARTTIRMQSALERNLPEDLVQALTEKGMVAGATGSGRSSRA